MKIILLIFVLSSLSAHARKLEFIKILKNSSPLELSGIAKYKNQFIVVSDNSEDTFFYNLKISERDFSFNKLIDISALTGYYPYRFKAYFDFHYPKLFKQQWDLEGISVCGDVIYFINEQHRHILKVQNNKLHKIDINLAPTYKKTGHLIESYGLNAGLEGIAVDCKTKTIYIAQEREPRSIFAFKEGNPKVEIIIQPEKDIEGELNHDFADLHFNNGYLYALDRNFRQISKIDVNAKEIIRTMTYEDLGGFNIRELYNIRKPYGLAEALYIENDQIILGIDNNFISFSEKAFKKFGFKGKDSTLLYFKRPKDF